MSEKERLLSENIEDYEAARRAAEKNVKENLGEISKRFSYAESLKKPLNQKQILLMWDQEHAGRDIPGQMLAYLQRTWGKKFTIVCCVKNSGETPLEGVTNVKVATSRFWEAAACSKYIISSTELPVAFVKREGQVYFYICEEAYQKESLMDEAGVSTLSRELLKSDYLYAPSQEEARRVWLEKAPFGRLYDGTVLVCRQPKEEAGALAELILGKAKAGNHGIEQLSLRDSSKKKLLVLTSWKNARELKYEVKNFLSGIDTDACEVTVLSPWSGAPGVFEDYISLPGEFVKLMYRGRLTMSEEEHLEYRIMEKNPDAYVKCKEIREYMDALMKREWQRIWGNQAFDECIVLGSLGYQQYYMALSGAFGKKVLMDLGFLEGLKEKDPARWRRAVSAFDEIYAPAASAGLGSYGPENKGKVFRLPVCVYNRREEEPETTEYNGRTYLVCDRWQQEDGKTELRLLLLPGTGSCLVNADLVPDEERRAYLAACLSGEPEVYLLGPNAGSYQSFLPKARALEESLRRFLYLLPAAGTFFKNIKAYYGDKTLEYDITGEICKIYGVPEK